MLWIRPASLRVRIVLPPTDFPKALPSHARYVFGPSTVSCVKASVSYMPPAVAAKTVATSSTPTHGLLITEVWSTGFAVKAAANSGIPLFRTIAIQSSPGLRAEGSIGIGLPSIKGEARQADFSPTLDGEARPAASKIRFAVSSGRASIATWLDAISTVLALMALAIALSRLGWMARSAVATRYQLGLAFHDATETFSPRAAAAVGACAANRMLFSIGVRSWAKSFFTPASVSFKKPCASGRTSAPIGAGSTLAPREPTDWPTSGAKAAM